MVHKIVLLLILWSLVSFTPSPKKKIFVVESYYSDFYWDKNVTKGLERGLNGKYELSYYYIDSKRLTETKRAKRIDEAWKKYLSLKPDLVVLYDDAALKFMGERLAKERTPFVFLGINGNPRDYFEKMPSHMTGILERPLFIRSSVILQKIYPKTKNVLVLFDTEMTSYGILTDVFHGKNSLSISGMNFDVKLVKEYEQWKELINSANNKYDFIIVGTYFALIDSKGKNVDADEVLKWTDQNSKRPCFGFWDIAIGKNKCIGGFVINEENMGEASAQIVHKIFQGTPPSAIPFANEAKGSLIFSRHQLKKWKVVLPKEVKSYATLID